MRRLSLAALLLPVALLLLAACTTPQRPASRAEEVLPRQCMMAWALSRATRESGRSPVLCGGAEVRFRRQNGVWVAEHILSAWRS